MIERSSEPEKKTSEVLAPTGTSAIKKNGKTLHSYLRILIRSFTELSGETLRTFQLKMGDIRYLIIDEYSVIGSRLMQEINKRCMAGKGNNEPFGGLHIYFFGDLRQLPPVKDIPLYGSAAEEFEGKNGIYDYRNAVYSYNRAASRR